MKNIFFIVLILLVPFNNLKGQLPQRKSFITPQVKNAIEKGLEFIAKNQLSDGSFTNTYFPIGVTSIAILSFLVNGELPEKGKYGKIIKKGLDYIIEKRDKLSGFMGKNMYEHCFATLILADAYGEYKSEELEHVLKQATNLIIKAQHPNGGWRYEPSPTGDDGTSDISVTAAAVQALRAAREAFIFVPTETIKKAVKYIKKCASSNGTFNYQSSEEPPDLGKGESDVIAKTGLGILSLMACGEYESKEVKKGLEYLMKNPKFDKYWAGYGLYYCTQAMYVAGGEYWEKWYPEMQKKILAFQKENGSFVFSEKFSSYGVVLDTSFAVISLSIQKGLMPLFQR
jgi:hypothetical protein